MNQDKGLPFTFSAFTRKEVLYSALEPSGLITHASSPGIDCCSRDFARGLPAVGIRVRRSFSTFLAGSWFLILCFGSLARTASTA